MKAKFEICYKCPHLIHQEDDEEVVSSVCELKEAENDYAMRGKNFIVASYDKVEKTLFRWHMDLPNACPYELEHLVDAPN
jgi:hypothetical protein